MTQWGKAALCWESRSSLLQRNLYFSAIQLTSNKVSSIGSYIHPIDGTREGAIEVSDWRAIKHLPITNLEPEEIRYRTCVRQDSSPPCCTAARNCFFKLMLGLYSWDLRQQIALLDPLPFQVFPFPHIVAHLPVCATCDKLVLIRMITHTLEQSVGQDHLTPHEATRKKNPHKSKVAYLSSDPHPTIIPAFQTLWEPFEGEDVRVTLGLSAE